MKAAEEGSTSEAANTPVKVAPVRKPVLELKRPVTREDVPQLQSAANLLKGTLTGEFSERQLQCLAKDPRVGPLYKTAMENCQQSAGKPRKFAACCSRHLCPTEQKEFIECIKATRDASACHEFRDGVERCGVRTSQRMLRAALSDDWF
eukprot:jgi/Undpi1/14061/HiC_scaffold_9.g03712.m1